MSAIRGRLAGLNARAQAVNTAHAARGRDIASTDYEAAYMPGTGGNGPRSSDTPDPTHNAAIRPKPGAPGQLELDTLRAIDTVAAFIHQLETWAETGNPNPKERRTAASPCRGGTMHMPDDKGGCMAQGCTRRWPDCTPDTVPRFEECQGTIPAGDTRCNRCELSIHNAICRDCLEVKDLKQMRSTNLCNACRMRTERAS